jgi:hypothetical protein
MKRKVPDSILGLAIDYLALCNVILANEQEAGWLEAAEWLLTRFAFPP